VRTKFLAPLAVLAAAVALALWFGRSSDRGVAEGRGAAEGRVGTLGKADPAKVAVREMRMWQAYYGGDLNGLSQELVALLHEDFGLPRADAVAVAGRLAAAAFKFIGLGGDYETRVLPDLEMAYETIRRATKGSWDAKAAARAELAWWVDRRIPERSSVENVGRSIARLYAVLLGKENDDIARAGYLRAMAAHVHDTTGDWAKVERLLTESYQTLARGARR